MKHIETFHKEAYYLEPDHPDYKPNPYYTSVNTRYNKIPIIVRQEDNKSSWTLIVGDKGLEVPSEEVLIKLMKLAKKALKL